VVTFLQVSPPALRMLFPSPPFVLQGQRIPSSSVSSSLAGELLWLSHSSPYRLTTAHHGTPRHTSWLLILLIRHTARCRHSAVHSNNSMLVTWRWSCSQYSHLLPFSYNG